MRTTTAVDWSWAHTTPSQSVPSTVGTRREREMSLIFQICFVVSMSVVCNYTASSILSSCMVAIIAVVERVRPH